jgi:hypothetical protein
MEHLTVGAAIDYVAEVGGSLRLEGERLKLRLPGNCPAENIIVETIRANRDVVAAMLRERESKPPSLEEVTAMLPAGVRVRKYEPKAVPFAVAPVSVVTDAGKFFRAYLKDLAWRLAHPDTYAAPPLADILVKLADGGLDLVTDGDVRSA